MENVTKALIMAGGLLISILVASFMVFVLRKAGSMNAEYNSQMSDNELAKFNSQFEIYARENNTFFDVITVANLAYDINTKNGWDTNNGIDVKVYDGTATVPMYSILVTNNAENVGKLKKNYFFDRQTVSENNQKYIYDEAFISENTEQVDVEEKRIYKYKFTCRNEIDYNGVTGKVKKLWR